MAGPYHNRRLRSACRFILALCTHSAGPAARYGKDVAVEQNCVSPGCRTAVALNPRVDLTFWIWIFELRCQRGSAQLGGSDETGGDSSEYSRQGRPELFSLIPEYFALLVRGHSK